MLLLLPALIVVKVSVSKQSKCIGDLEYAIIDGKKIHNSVKKGTPFASVMLEILWDYYNKQKKYADIARSRVLYAI